MKKFICLFLISFFLIIGFSFGAVIKTHNSSENSVNEDINLNIQINDSEVAKHIFNAERTNSINDKIKEYALAVKVLSSKKNKTNNDVIAIASILVLMGDYSKNLADFKNSLNSYLFAYNTLKDYKLHKNSPLSVYCLSNIYYMADAFNNDEMLKFSTEELETTQLQIAKKIPDIYEQISAYYERIGNKRKAEYYKKFYYKEQGQVKLKKNN